MQNCNIFVTNQYSSITGPTTETGILVTKCRHTRLYHYELTVHNNFRPFPHSKLTLNKSPDSMIFVG